MIRQKSAGPNLQTTIAREARTKPARHDKPPRQFRRVGANLLREAEKGWRHGRGNVCGLPVGKFNGIVFHGPCSGVCHVILPKPLPLVNKGASTGRISPRKALADFCGEGAAEGSEFRVGHYGAFRAKAENAGAGSGDRSPFVNLPVVRRIVLPGPEVVHRDRGGNRVCLVADLAGRAVVRRLTGVCILPAFVGRGGREDTAGRRER